jgi:hypothetical protein
VTAGAKANVMADEPIAGEPRVLEAIARATRDIGFTSEIARRHRVSST